MPLPEPDQPESDLPKSDLADTSTPGTPAADTSAPGTSVSGTSATSGETPASIYAPEEVRPPVPEANSFGGGIDAADLPPTLPDDADGPGSAHDADGWRAIETRP